LPYAEAVYLKTPLMPRHRVGAAPFSVGSRGWGWALSPCWIPSNDWDMGACIIAEVFDPLSDGPPAQLKSWEERKVGCKVLEQDVGGTWSGEEISEGGEALGTLTVELVPEWKHYQTPDGASVPTCNFSPIGIPLIIYGTLGPATLDMSLTAFRPMVGGATFQILHDVTDIWTVSFSRSTGRTLYMRTQRGNTQMSHAVLSLKSPGVPLPPPDVALLKRLPRQVSPTWSPRRKADAELVFHALTDLDLRYPT